MSEIKELTFKNIDQVDEKTLTLAKILVEKKLIRIDYKNEDTWVKFPFKICEKGTLGSDYAAENLLDFEKKGKQCFSSLISHHG